VTRDTLTKLIEKQQESIVDDVRDYIGASSIGSDCWRQIWYQYKGFKGDPLPPKVRRTFDIGKALESTVYGWLSNADLLVSRTMPEIIHPTMPFFKGNVDGVLIDLEEVETFIIEIKTAKDSSFKTFVNKGVKLWMPQYYAQVQAYMGLSGIFSTYILVLNKDNSDLSDELVLFDEEYYKKLENKAMLIASAETEPPRVNGSALWYQCKMCKYNKVCHV
jgi:hypothetical protein